MRSYLTFLKSNGMLIILGFLFAFMIQGCSTPLVKVENNTTVGECSEDGLGGGPGACQNKAWQNQSATGFWNMDNDTIIQASENKFCTATGSQKCRYSGTASSCMASGKPNYCYSTYTNSPNPGTCLCACGQL